MLDSNFSNVKANRNQNQLARRGTRGGGLQLSTFALAPRWAVYLKNRRTSGEAATSIFWPVDVIDTWDFPVSACPPRNTEATVESA